MTNRSRIAIALAAIAGGITTASADPIIVIEFTYHDLAGSYVQSSPGNGAFTAVAADAGSLHSTGTVSRTDGNPGSAAFESGFVSAPNLADFHLSLSVVTIVPGMIASGSGDFVSTDRNGDTLFGHIDGTWSYDFVQGFTNFNGTLSDVHVANNSGDNSFDGTQAGSWQISPLNATTLDGAITQIHYSSGAFFPGDFRNAATGLDGQLVPTPGALALLGLGGLVSTRRRR